MKYPVPNKLVFRLDLRKKTESATRKYFCASEKMIKSREYVEIEKEVDLLM